jgi:SAM-dependent methyltransferase
VLIEATTAAKSLNKNGYKPRLGVFIKSNVMVIDPIRIALEALNAESFERAVLAQLERSVGFTAAFMLAKARDARPAAIGFDAQELAHALAAPSAYEVELAPVRQAALARRGVAVDSEVLGEQGVRRATYFQQFAMPRGARHSLLAFLSLRGGATGLLMLGRDGAGFSARDVEQIEAALPALAVAHASFRPVLWTPQPGLPVGKGRFSWLDRLYGKRAHIRASRVMDGREILIRDKAGFREMVARRDRAELVWSSAALSRPSESGWPYIDLFNLAVAWAESFESALLVGCGGGVALHQFARLYPKMELTVVESEPAVVELARTWFALDAIANLSIRVNDGVSFINRADANHWDVVLIDAYDEMTASERECSSVAISQVHRVLRSGGVLAVNVIGTLAGDGPVRRVIEATRNTFEQVRIVPVMECDEAFSPHALRNVVVLARKRRSTG